MATSVAKRFGLKIIMIESIIFKTRCLSQRAPNSSFIGRLPKMITFNAFGQSMSERRSFSRERNKSAAQFFKKERKVSAVRKNQRARVQNTLFLSALFDSSVPEKLFLYAHFSYILKSFLNLPIFFSYTSYSILSKEKLKVSMKQIKFG